MNETEVWAPTRVPTLNKEQQESVDSLDGALMIVAVAGSGKTTVLIHRAANLVANNVPPERILMITFTKYAANNMKNRAIKLADKRCANIYTSTFHSFYADMLRRFGSLIDVDQNFAILSSDGDVEDSISDTMIRLTKYSSMEGFPSMKTLRELYSYSINSGYDISSLVQGDENLCKFEDEIIDLYDIWVEEKNRTSTYTYDDLMLKMHELVNTEDGCTAVSSLFDYIMVDEYQDINQIQNEILTRIASEHRNIAIVGDDYQAIYRFRGSSTKYIEQYEENNQDAKRVTIDTNYRSSDEIIAFVNEVMHRECHFGIQKDMKGTGQHFDPVTINYMEDEDDEHQHIVGEIIKSHNMGTLYSEMAVLSRTSKRLGKLEVLLVQNQIPYEIRGGTKFLDRDEMRDMKALLACIVRPNHKNTRLSWYRVLKELAHGVGEKTASDICEDSTIYDFLLLEKNQGSSYSKELVAMDTAVKRIRMEEETSGYLEALKQLITWYFDTRIQLIRVGRYQTESNRTAAYEELDEKRDTLDTFYEIAKEYASFSSLLDGISMNEFTQPSDDNVCLSTVHSAKGLEWDQVYMIDVIDLVYPGFTLSQEEEEESLRLFYVGMTRAKKQLIMYVPEYYLVKGVYKQVHVSPFIQSTVRAGGPYVKEQHISRYDILHHQKLEFEMIPDTLYGKNARAFLSERDWDIISSNVRKIGRCACCGQAKETAKLHAHEVWDYNDKKHVQTLLDVIPVCDICHAVIHIGHSIHELNYTEDQLLEYYCKVNNVSKEQAIACLQNARIKIASRNQFNWEQDTSSIVNRTKRYLSVSHQISSERKEVHLVSGVNFHNKDEFKEWCANMGIRAKWNPELKMWGYLGDYCEEAEKKWNT